VFRCSPMRIILCNGGHPMATVEVNGIEMHFEVEGSGESLVLIHGLGSSSLDWRNQVRHFASKYQVVAYDVRGHGRTDKPRGPYSMELFASDTAALLSHLEIAQAHVVGVSMGGMIGFQLAVSYPSVLKSLIPVNSGPALRIQTLKDRLQMWQRLLIVRLLGMRGMATVLATRLFPNPEQEAIRLGFIERFSTNNKRAYVASMKALIGWGVEDRISEMDIPTLFVSGDQDYTPVELKQTFADMMPNARVAVIEDSRHATPIDQPRRFNRVVEEFVEELR
jgi:3-oxoadipate enol-lactonase